MHRYNCEFCNKEMELGKKWDGTLYFGTSNHSHSVSVMVLRNKHDASGGIMEAITKPICLDCFKTFVAQIEK